MPFAKRPSPFTSPSNKVRWVSLTEPQNTRINLQQTGLDKKNLNNRFITEHIKMQMGKENA